MASPYEQAKEEGYSDEEIARHLAQQRGVTSSLEDAIKEGYSYKDIIDHLLSTQAVKEKPVKPETSEAVKETSLLSRSIDSIAQGFLKNVAAPLQQADKVRTEAYRSAGKIVANAAIETLLTPVEIVDAIGTVTDSETIANIKQSEFGKAFSEKLEYIRPDLESDEKIASNILTMLTVAGAGRKVFREGMELLVEKVGATKAKKIAIEMNKQMGGKTTDMYSRSQKVAVGLSSATGASAGVIQADVQTRPEDMQLASQLINQFPEAVKAVTDNVPLTDKLKDLALQLEIQPDDDQKTKLLKQYGDAALLEIPLVAAVGTVSLLGRYGPKGVKKLLKEAANTDAGKAVIEKSAPAVEKVARINTNLGRIFTQRAALPEELYGPSVVRQNNTKYLEATINEDLRQLKVAQKKHKVSNEELTTYFNTGEGPINPNVKEVVDNLKIQITRNESNIADLLGIKGGKFGIRSDGQDFFVTRQYSSALSPKDRKKLSAGISKHQGGKPLNDRDINRRIQGALRVIDPNNKMTREEQSYVLQKMVDNMAKPEGGWYRSIFEGINDTQRKVVESNAKVLAKRNQDLPVELREFLGEVTNPYKGLQSTLMNQGQVLSQLRYFDEVRKIASESSGEPLKLPGLFPVAPSRKEAFREGAKAGDVKLSEIIQESIGRFGGSSPRKTLGDPAVSEYFARMISRGLDVYDVNKQGNVMAALSKISSFGQATQTLLDIPAYVLNTSGMVQMLLANGHHLNPKNYVRAVGEINTFAQQVIKSNPEALEKLAMLKGLGVIDQDVTGEMIAQNARIFGDKKGNIASRAYAKGMERVGRAYGQPDLYGKLVAFESEKAAQRAIHPTKSEDWINTRAAEVVKATMPTYGAAPAAFRQLSRFPLVGNYTLFPVELVRTSKNVVKYGLKDIKEGMEAGNPRQIATGLRRLAGLGTVAVGFDQANTQLKKHFGITDDHLKTMSILNPEWQRGSTDYFLAPVMIDETGADNITSKTVMSQFPKEDWGEIKERFDYKGTYEQFIKERLNQQKRNYEPFIKTRTLNSAAVNTFDYIAKVAKTATGKIFGSEIMSDQQLEEAYGTLGSQIAGQFVAPKIAVQAAMNVLTGTNNRTGKKVYENYAGITLKEKIKNGLDELLKPIYAGGSYKIIDDFIKINNAEELLGLGNAERKSGHPMTKEDLYVWGATGGRPETRNLTKEMGWNLYQDMLPLSESKARFQKAIYDLDPQVVTSKTMDEIVGIYKDSQERSRVAMQKLVRKIEVFGSTPVLIKRKVNGKVKTIKDRVGIERVLEAATRGFKEEPNARVVEGLQGLINGLKSTMKQGREGMVYIPDNPLTDRFINSLLDKGFTNEQIGEISLKAANVLKDQAQRPLFEEEQQ